MLDMPSHCVECGQKFELETGFWYGTGYVSYGLAVAFSVFTFILWWLTVGFSVDDNRLIYWLITNGVLIVLLQPWFMRLSRTIYLYFFVKYNPNYRADPTVRYT